MSASIIQIEQSILDALSALYADAVTTIVPTTTTDYSTGTEEDPLTGETIVYKYLVWQYSITDLLNELYMRTSNRAKQIKNKEGQMNHDFILSPDESVWIDSALKDRANDVMRIIAPYTADLPSAFLIDEAPDIETWSVKAWVADDYIRYTDNKIYLCILANNGIAPDAVDGTTYWTVQPDWIDSTDKITFFFRLPDYLNDNVAPSIDRFMYAMLRDNVLADWYQNCGLLNDFDIYRKLSEEDEQKLKNTFLQRTVILTASNRFY